ncbi:universal stress protein [Sneathiella sp.]|jgi:nucleotide-binding universal stress UspA family protein|uniref:universal stress protein n=1 Tax=Sneathiella sp. TaxID=1964365 RepID=UPI0025E1E983|nr:universal stress protein [Sneathiella sp.]|tara:strand:+ start:5976 stop:6860 length:885 start_codon:yes stop_codon:yes gene_type:complete
MYFKNILVPLSGAANDCDTAALESAFNLASRFGAHVNALHIKIDPRTAAAFVGEGMTSTMIESVIDMAEKEGQDRRQRAHATFDKVTAALQVPLVTNMADRPNATGASARFVEMQGNSEDTIHSYGRLFDLIIICKQEGEEQISNSLLINTALRETGRPVLLLDSTQPHDMGKRVAFAWNGSVEASRALSYSLPFLQTAENVTLISAIDDLDEAIYPEAVQRYLAMYGVTADRCEISGTNGKSTAESIIAAATKSNADLLVMGAYTRSRLRRLFFGAVTEEILNNCPIPVFMAH